MTDGAIKVVMGAALTMVAGLAFGAGVQHAALGALATLIIGGFLVRR